MVEVVQLDSNTQTPSKSELGPSVLLRVWLQKECSPRNEEWKNKEKGGQIPEITQHSSA